MMWEKFYVEIQGGHVTPLPLPGGADGGEGGKRRTPVRDCESAKMATLKCGGPPTMPDENRGPWSKKFENRCCML